MVPTKYESKQQLNIHTNAVHLRNYSKCDICNAKFQDKQGLKTRIESIHEERKLKCQL